MPLGLAAGTYHLMCASSSGGGALVLTLAPIDPTNHDYIANAKEIDALPYHDTFDGGAATWEDGDPSCNSYHAGFWHHLNAESGACLTTAGSQAIVDVYLGGIGSLSDVSCGTSYYYNGGEQTFYVAAGESYYLHASSGGTGALALGLVSDGSDGDGDGVPDTCDNCPASANSDQLDSDHDRVGDACDLCPFVAYDNQYDNDHDGIGNACDNCPDIWNATQSDGDGDAYGDVCDNCPSVANNGQTDSDRDRVGDLCDNCYRTANADQSNLDGDGRGDACDLCVEDVAVYPAGWSRSGDLVTSRKAYGATLLELGPFAGQVLIVGGVSGRGAIGPAGNYRLLASTELYDPQSGTWREHFPLPRANAGISATALTTGSDAGKVLVIGNGTYGGRSFVTIEPTVEGGPWLYDPADGSFIAAPEAPFSIIIEPTALRLLDGRVLVQGLSLLRGASEGDFYAFYYYPESQSWSYEPGLDAKLGEPYAASATLLDDGRVFLRSESSIAAIIYDPVSDTGFIGAALEKDPRGAAVATLPGGRVLAVGGHFNGGAVGIYDVAADAWSAGEPLPNVRRSDVAAVRLLDGRVIVPGGFTVDMEYPVQNTMRRTDVYEPRGDDDGDGILDGDDLCPCGDEVPPVIAASAATPSLLWPPNGQLVPVRIDTSASDACGAEVTCLVSGVSGDGDSGDSDWRITGPATLELRARHGQRNTERVYSVTVTCLDDAGNAATATTTVVVPRDNR